MPVLIRVIYVLAKELRNGPICGGNWLSRPPTGSQPGSRTKWKALKFVFPAENLLISSDSPLTHKPQLHLTQLNEDSISICSNHIHLPIRTGYDMCRSSAEWGREEIVLGGEALGGLTEH